jgi:microcin C transport system permease protein
VTGRPSESLLRRRLRKFKSLKRGYYSFILLLLAYLASFFFPFVFNNKALVVYYEGNAYFPAALDLVDRIYLGITGI